MGIAGKRAWTECGSGSWFKGSFTVEAVFLYPIMIGLFAFMLCLAIDWYEGISETAKDTDTVMQLDTRGNFLKGTTIESLVETLTDR